MKKPRCGTEPTWELFRSDAEYISKVKDKVKFRWG